MMMLFPDSPEAIDAAYLESILKQYTGEPDPKVTAFNVQRLDKGTSGSRLYVITVERTSGDAPLRLVLKTDGGENEVFFYRDLAARVPVDTARVLDARILDDGRAWLLMEEIVDVKDDLTWDEPDYKAVLSDMARLHAQFWGQTNLLDDSPWLWRPDDRSLKALAAARKHDLDVISASWLPQALPEVFPRDRLLLAKMVLEQPFNVFGPLLASGTTLVHGDYWFHNVQIARTGRRVLVDWQDPQVWSGHWELVYFLNLLLAVGPGTYREELPFDEALMISWYADALAEAGVAVPKSAFDRALLAARVWHPLQHWVRQYGNAVSRDLLPTRSLQDHYPDAVRFMESTFSRWEEDARTLLGA